jgi:hypothetical protein
MPTPRIQHGLLTRRFCIYVTPEIAKAIDIHARTTRLMQPSSWAREALLAQLAAEGHALPRFIASRMKHCVRERRGVR